MVRQAFEELTASIKEAGEIKRGTAKPSRRFTVTPTSVRNIRRSFSASQGRFARILGVSVNTLQNWEQGRCYPTGPAKVLLVIAARNPDLLISTLGQDAAPASRGKAFA